MIRLILKSQKTFDQFTEDESLALQTTFGYLQFPITNSIMVNNSVIFDGVANDNLVIDNLPVKVEPITQIRGLASPFPLNQVPDPFIPTEPVIPDPVIPTPVIQPSVTISGLTFDVLGAWFGAGSKIDEMVPLDSSYFSYFPDGTVAPNIPNSEAGFGWPWI